MLYVSAILFIALAVYFVSIEQYFVAALPFGIVLILIAVFSLDKLLYIIAFLAPVSVQLRFFMSVENDLSLPIEPLLFGIFLVVLYKLAFENHTFDKKLLTHPVSIAIYLNLLWIIITSFTSTMPLVSFKFTLSRMWYLAAFYIMAIHLFKNKGSIYNYFWLYVSGFIIVILYTLARQSSLGLFDKKVANWVVTPLLPDHTSYGAILAMVVPFIVLCLFLKRYAPAKKIMIFLVGALYLVALIFSYTRAAWLGLAMSVGLFVLLALRIKGRTIVVLGVVTLTVILTFSTQIIMHLEKNRQDSSDNLSEQLNSVTNISTDASNLERINRWNSALRMFEERPIMGFGPGTYMFQYAPYQFTYEKTIISTNFGEVGNAHSEFLGPLAESGVLGSLTFTFILILTGITAFRVYQKAVEKEIRLLSMALFLGLFSYYVHGFLNNFLDIDKFSLLFWGFTAAIVALDVLHPKEKKKELEIENQSHSI
jgi:O-antigen ligase